MNMRFLTIFSLLILLTPQTTRADVTLNNLFGDHMVLQQGIANKIWGKADPGENILVSIAKQKHSTIAKEDGNWSIQLDAIVEYGGPHTLTVTANNIIMLQDILVGEVWICSGQSNMQFSVQQADDADLEMVTAQLGQIRLISVPQVGTQEPQWNFKGEWAVCSPETVGSFSAVGFFFGRQIHQTLNVPVGLIDNAWGGSACEAWIDRKLLSSDEQFTPLLDRWSTTESDMPKALMAYEKKIDLWKQASEKARTENKSAPRRPRNPESLLTGNSRPGNIYCGVLSPTVGYGIKGAIWYQGESNASRAAQYRELFPYMITSWRNEWGIGDFPFYWVQLADFKAENVDPTESEWAELREAQTMTLKKIKNTGEAVIIDLGEGKDIHPRNKIDVAKRLARLALAETYDIPRIVCRSPQYQSMKKHGNKIVLFFSHVKAQANGWRPFDVRDPIGFTIANSNKKFVAANARILADGHIEVWSDTISDPIAVRYAWADNPICNMYSSEGLPLTPFRTDNFPSITEGRN